jgi:hypothetical protein
MSFEELPLKPSEQIASGSNPSLFCDSLADGGKLAMLIPKDQNPAWKLPGLEINGQGADRAKSGRDEFESELDAIIRGSVRSDVLEAPSTTKLAKLAAGALLKNLADGADPAKAFGKFNLAYRFLSKSEKEGLNAAFARAGIDLKENEDGQLVMAMDMPDKSRLTLKYNAVNGHLGASLEFPRGSEVMWEKADPDKVAELMIERAAKTVGKLTDNTTNPLEASVHDAIVAAARLVGIRKFSQPVPADPRIKESLREIPPGHQR